jgi:hypothetical protein
MRSFWIELKELLKGWQRASFWRKILAKKNQRKNHTYTMIVLKVIMLADGCWIQNALNFLKMSE